jgi:hypothetical protein
MKFESSGQVFENAQIPNFFKISQLGAESVHADRQIDRQTDRQTERQTETDNEANGS